MLTRSLCLFLIVGSLVQANHGAPSIIVIAQYIPKILHLSVDVARTVVNGTTEILKTQGEIKLLVDSAELTVKARLLKLDQLVEESKAKANQTNKNITSCLEEEEQHLNSIHLQVLEKCRLQDGVKHLYSFAMKLAKEEVSLPIKTQWCIIKYPLDGDQLKECFDDKIDDVEDKVKEFKKEMKKTIPEAKKYSRSCTKNNLDALVTAIDDVSSTFENCTSAYLLD